MDALPRFLAHDRTADATVELFLRPSQQGPDPLGKELRALIRLPEVAWASRMRVAIVSSPDPASPTGRRRDLGLLPMDGSATGGPARAGRSRGWRRSSSWPGRGRCRGCCTSRRRRPTASPRLAELLDRVKRDGSDSYRYFRTPAELGRLVREDLATLLSERFAAVRTQAADPGSRPAPSGTPGRRGPRPLPVATTSLVGREQAIDEVIALLAPPEARLVTLTGPGGIGKTRLALAAGERLRDRFDAGTAFVPLAGVTQPEQVLTGIGRAVGVDLAGTDSSLEALVEQFGDDRWLLVLDNLEQVLEAARDLDQLLARCGGVAILATSLTVLGLRAEHVYPVPPLPLPADLAGAPAEALMASPAVALFVDRARAVRPGFALTDANAPAVVELCRRLEGVPLAIELAAARTRLLNPAALLGRLARSLDALGTGAVDLPERQHTLRATVEWSVGLLEDDERSLLETMAVFVGGWTFEAGAQVAGLDQDRALALSEALERHSLIQLDRTDLGPRLRMLETVRAFVAERLAARPDAAEIGRRHADHYRTLAERADRPLRGLDQDHWAERLEAEAGNLAAAVEWYLANDRAPLPRMFRVLWMYWGLRDHLGEARAWIDQLLPTADSLDPQAQAELLWTTVVTALEVVGDDAAALAASQRLASLLERIQDPYLHAVCQLAMAGGGSRPGGAVRPRRPQRLGPGAAGHPGPGPGPPRGGPDPPGRGAGAEPGHPQHPQRDPVPDRIRPAGVRRG